MTIKAIHKQRLLRLADFLDTVPPTEFYFGSWVGGWPQRTAVYSGCGTTACALGWATAIPEFQALGLYLTTDRHGVACPALQMSSLTQSWDLANEAANSVFGLSPKEVTWLFTPSEYDPQEDWDSDDEDFGSDGKPYADASAKAVATHIRNFVAE